MADDDRVFQAANTVLVRGGKPSWESVRTILGGGSKSTIVPALNRYWKECGWRALLTPLIPQREADQDDLVPRSKMDEAIALADSEQRRLMNEVDSLRQQLEAARSAPVVPTQSLRPIMPIDAGSPEAAEVKRLQKIVADLMTANTRLAVEKDHLEVEVSDLRCLVHNRQRSVHSEGNADD